MAEQARPIALGQVSEGPPNAPWEGRDHGRKVNGSLCGDAG
jgi:hypothetical protein